MDDLASGSGRLRGVCVLILENDFLVALAMADTLVELGCRVAGPAATSAGAMALLAGEPVDVALLDVNLDRGDTGYSVAAFMSAKNLPFAFVTGDGAHRLDARFAGTPSLQKPFNRADLVNILQAMAPALTDGD